VPLPGKGENCVRLLSSTAIFRPITISIGIGDGERGKRLDAVPDVDMLGRERKTFLFQQIAFQILRSNVCRAVLYLMWAIQPRMSDMRELENIGRTGQKTLGGGIPCKANLELNSKKHVTTSSL
jgi:hypothetical protein